jgi:hypothetical protein
MSHDQDPMTTQAARSLTAANCRPVRSFVTHHLSLVIAAALLLATACIAPLSRTSVIRPGLGFEGGAGLSEYRGHAIATDSSSWWGGRAVLQDINVGLFGMVRASYGFKQMYGVDLTLAGAWGAPIQANGRWGGWLQIALAGKIRPWRSNHLFFAELAPPSLALGWTGGFPFNRPEQWSLTARVGTTVPEEVPEQITLNWLAQLWPPQSIQLNLARNVRVRTGRAQLRISPNAGIGVGLFSGGSLRPSLSNIVAGITLGQ